MIDEELEAIRRREHDFFDMRMQALDAGLDRRNLLAEVDRLRTLTIPVITHACATTHSACECVLKQLESLHEGLRLAKAWRDACDNRLVDADDEHELHVAATDARAAFSRWLEVQSER